jgi:hypothetical protein
MVNESGSHLHSLEFSKLVDEDFDQLLRIAELVNEPEDEVNKSFPAVLKFVRQVRHQTDHLLIKTLDEGISDEGEVDEAIMEKMRLQPTISMEFLFWCGYKLGASGYKPHACEDDHAKQTDPQAN